MYHFNFMPFVRFWVSKATFLLISRKVLFRKLSLTYLWIAIVTCIILGVFFYSEHSIVPPIIDLNALWHIWKQCENFAHFWREWELTRKFHLAFRFPERFNFLAALPKSTGLFLGSSCLVVPIYVPIGHPASKRPVKMWIRPRSPSILEKNLTFDLYPRGQFSSISKTGHVA